MILSPFMRNWPWFLEVTRDLTILSHLSSVKGILLMGGWATACSSLFLARSLWRSLGAKQMSLGP